MTSLYYKYTYVLCMYVVYIYTLHFTLQLFYQHHHIMQKPTRKQGWRHLHRWQLECLLAPIKKTLALREKPPKIVILSYPCDSLYGSCQPAIQSLLVLPSAFYCLIDTYILQQIKTSINLTKMELGNIIERDRDNFWAGCTVVGWDFIIF